MHTDVQSSRMNGLQTGREETRAQSAPLLPSVHQTSPPPSVGSCVPDGIRALNAAPSVV